MKLTTSIILSTILLAILYFNYGNYNSSVNFKPVNTASLISNKSSSTESKLEAKPKAPSKQTEDKLLHIETDNSKDESQKNDQALDYITAYRDWQYFQNCYTDVEDFHNNKDPLDTLKERFANNPRESQTQPTTQQNMYYQQHVDICKAMIVDEKDDYFANINRLEQIFKNITPTTAAEKQLERSLSFVSQLRQLRINYSRSHPKRSTLSAEQLRLINLQIDDVTARLLNLYDNTGELSEDEKILLQNYSQELDELNAQIIDSQMIDTKILEKINRQIDKHLNVMDDFLKSVTSPDAYLVITSVLYKSEYLQKDSTILRQLKQQTGIWDSYYIDILNKITMPLVACSMNYPCDANSDYILSYCLGLRGSMFNQACGLNLEDFYFNFYIGTNQLNDVNTYFQYMVNRYEQ